MSSDNVYHLSFHRKKTEQESQPSSLELEAQLQMQLPFDAPEVLMFTLTSDYGPGQFADFAQGVSPRVLVDMRIAPRLDFICTTRAQTLDYLTAISVHYRDVLGKVGISSYADADERHQAIVCAVVDLLRSIEQRLGPALFFFDEPAFMQRCKRYFEGGFEVLELDGRSIERVASEASRLQM